MARRPISAEMRQWLTEELEAWHAEGILDHEQAGRILDHYETVEEIADRKHSRALFVLSGLAMLMIALAALLLVGYNWEAMPAAAKLTILFGSLLGAYGTAFWLRFKMRIARASEIVFFLGGLLYGVCIWQIAQIFHIQSHYPDGIWYWAVGVLPLALCLDTPLLHTLYAALLALWAGTEILGFDTPRMFWSYVPNGAYSLPLLALPGLLWAYRKQSATTVALYVPLLAWWAILQPVVWHWELDSVYFIGLAGSLMLMIAELHPVGSRMAVPYRLFGVAIVGGALVPLSFADFLINLQHHHLAEHGYDTGLVIGLIGAVAALVAIFLQWRGTAGKSTASARTLALLRRQWLPFSTVALMTALCLWNTAFYASGSGHSYYSAFAGEKWAFPVLIPTAIVNAMMIVLALWLMRVGLREDQSRLFAGGVLYFLLWAVLRYVDLFGGVGGMLGASIMFLLCGLGLLAVVRFWHKRKETGHV